MLICVSRWQLHIIPNQTSLTLNNQNNQGKALWISLLTARWKHFGLGQDSFPWQVHILVQVHSLSTQCVSRPLACSFDFNPQASTHWKRPWCWERQKATGEGEAEDEIVGWHHLHTGHESEQNSRDSEGQRSLACCSPWGHKESDTTEWTTREGVSLSIEKKPPQTKRPRLKMSWLAKTNSSWHGLVFVFHLLTYKRFLI